MATRIGELPRSEPVYVSCQSGSRSGQAVGPLRGLDARSVLGGTDTWIGAGRQVVVGGRSG